ncbi:general secretion pathway protein GspB [Ideonella sp. BN130291]|uniref:general secretion pathway protein GspB n=1 Tax=Ideonella sp. BN130291 TaxID=3112940 RepID=UPI002E26A7A9|nr:general secretion pathway protein GspB [Ideonella sp. BN130291]
MSYVLDALKKADAQRELARGGVPGLHTQPMPAASDAERGPVALAPWMWTAVGAGAVLVGALVWRLWPQAEAPAGPIAVAPALLPSAAPSVVATPPAPMPAPITQAHGSAATQAPAPAPPVVQPPPAVAHPPAATRVAESPAVVARPPTQPQPAQPVQPAQKAPPVAARTTPGPVPDATAAARPATDAAGHDTQPEGRILSQRELPPEIQRELPPLVVGGSIYSESPANRFLILNGQVLHENDKLGPELTLEQIRLKLAVLRYKGYRFRITY